MAILAERTPQRQAAPLGIPAEEPWAANIRTTRDAASYIADWAETLFGRVNGAEALEALADAVGGDLGDRLSDQAQGLTAACRECGVLLPPAVTDLCQDCWRAKKLPLWNARRAALTVSAEAEALWQEPAMANVGLDEDAAAWDAEISEHPCAGLETFDPSDRVQEESARA